MKRGGLDDATIHHSATNLVITCNDDLKGPNKTSVSLNGILRLLDVGAPQFFIFRSHLVSSADLGT